MIEAIHTPCKKCVFAKYEDKTQIGCELNYIEKFKNINSEILEVYDEDLEFYVINNKKCLGYRENSWFKKLDMEEASLEEKKEYFLKHNHINYLLVIDLANLSIEDFSRIKEAIIETEYAPNKVIFIRYVNNVQTFSFDIINQFLKDTKLDKTKWRIQTMEDNNHQFEDILHTIIALNKSNRFIMYIKLNNSHDYPIKNICVKANTIIYDEMGKADIVANKDKTCVLFSAPSYRFSLLALKTNLFSQEELYTYI